MLQSSADHFDAIMKRAERQMPFIKDPMACLNVFGVFYVFTLIGSLFFANAYITCPKMYGEEGCRVPINIGLFIMAEIFLNFLCFHWYSKRNRITNILPGRLQTAQDNTHTRFCVSCNEVVPTKSHHCPFCKYCIMRKDHHCVILNGCVGFGNQRYFIGFLFWASLGSAYGTVINFLYLNQFYKPFLPFGWIDYIGPVALKRWMFMQHCTVMELTLVLLISFSFASTIGAFAFLVTQMFFTCNGTTMHEWSKKKVQSDYVSPGRHHEPEGLRERLQAVFGPYWAMNFIVPCPWWPNQFTPGYIRSLHDYYMKDI